jgi:hypothetical protein
VRLERLDDSLNQMRQVMERWDKRLERKGLNVSEGYLEGRMEFLIEFKTFNKGHVNDYRAILYRSDTVIDERHGDATVPKHGEVGSLAVGGCGDQGNVFVVNVEVMDGAKRNVASLVRLERAENINDIWGSPVYVSLFNGTLKGGVAGAKRKVNVINFASICANQVASQQIEGGAKIMDCISDDGRKVIGRRLLDSDGHRALTGMIATLNHNSVGIEFKVSGDLRVQLGDVAFGPINL